MLIAGGAAGYVGFKFDLPMIVHLPLALVVGMLAGALWGGIAGLLKARTGAHEVIVTIMLNYVAYYLLFYALTKDVLLGAPGSGNPKSLPMKDTAILPKVLGDRFNLHLGFVLALVAVADRVVAAQPLHPRLPDPRRRVRTRTRPAPPASTSAGPTRS